MPAASIVCGPVSRPLAWMIPIPSPATCSAMSFDCAAARALIRVYRAGASTPSSGLAPSASSIPSEAERASEVMVDDDSISVLLGTQSVSTQAPPRPSSSTTCHLGTELGGHKRGFVAAWPAAQDGDAWTWQGHVKQLSRTFTTKLHAAPADWASPGFSPGNYCRAAPYLQELPYHSTVKTAIASGARRLRRRLRTVALYAAYGSNMDPAQMLLRCPHSPQRGTGWLEGWRLTFGGEELGWDGALTTVVEDTAQRVFVALYDVPENDEKELDVWDGVNLGFYSKIKVRVQALDGDALAWLYVLDAYEGGLPSAERLSILVDAALKAGAPADYVDWLRARPSNPPSGPLA